MDFFEWILNLFRKKPKPSTTTTTTSTRKPSTTTTTTTTKKDGRTQILINKTDKLIL